MKKVCVIGGGPSGMMAAYSAAKECEVTLFEKNEKLGKKLFITGKGRCNVTNSKDISEFFNEIPRNEKFLYSALYTFTNDAMVKLLKEFGVETKIERGGRIFPKSDKSSDIIKAYEKMLDSRNVRVKLNYTIKKIEQIDGKFILNSNREEAFDYCIIATGGISYSSTGSTGDGYKFAENFGIKVEPQFPALIPIELKDYFLEELQGLSLKNVNLVVKKNKKIISEEFGEMLFSHFGITGPIVLKTSSKINRLEGFKMYIDFKPALSLEELDNRVLKDFEEVKNKEFKNALNNLLPKKLIPVVIKKSGIEDYKKVNSISKEERQRLVKIIKEFPLEYKGLLDINASIITSGGINVRELDPSTMESKKIKNLYFVGEVVDVEGYTGGFNIQIANSTGYLSGVSICENRHKH